MVNRSTSRRTGATTILVLVLVLGLLIGGGLSVRTLIAKGFDATTYLRETLGISRQSLVAQLDEETGVRGFSVTHDRRFLQPYIDAHRILQPQLADLIARLQTQHIDVAATAAIDARDVNGYWIQDIATPLIGDRRLGDPLELELDGKELIDRYRSDIDEINTAIDRRTQEQQQSVRDAIDRINLLVAFTVLLIAAIGAGVLEAQRRSERRIQRERLRAEREEREAQALRAAYNAEKRIADSLQEAIAQRPLPTIPTLRFSATYVPATEETMVGGDWYDALELPNNRVLFAIGDVTGHGIEAAVTMNRARQSLISSALLEGDPAAVLRRVNDEMFVQRAPLVTAVAGFADAGTYEFVYATAGHPPPLLIEPGRRPRLLECGSLPLGALAGTEYKLYRIQSVPGATLVLYTDGAVEHSRNVLEGEEILIAAAGKAAEQREVDTASFIHATIFEGRSVGDDVAILTIAFATDGAAGMRISADDAQSAYAGRLRRGAPSPGAVRAFRAVPPALERLAS
jgi:serine phosphatase RsbU (regulator of sigma subunit)